MTAKGPAESALIRFDHVSKAFGSNQVLRDISLSVDKGEIVCLIGPSGSGKSTLLRSVNCLNDIDSGDIYVDGETVGFEDRRGKRFVRTEADRARMRSKIGMVFQHFNLFDGMSAWENVAYAPRVVHNTSKADAKKRALELLTLVGLKEHAEKFPKQLSGGQQQRVAIARALAVDPVACLFDEPTSALDPELVGDVLDVMRHLAQTGLTMLVATHEIAFAREISSRIVVLVGGEIIEQGPPEQVIDNPQNPRTQRFLSRLHTTAATHP